MTSSRCHSHSPTSKLETPLINQSTTSHHSSSSSSLLEGNSINQSTLFHPPSPSYSYSSFFWNYLLSIAMLALPFTLTHLPLKGYFNNLFWILSPTYHDPPTDLLRFSLSVICSKNQSTIFHLPSSLLFSLLCPLGITKLPVSLTQPIIPTKQSLL